MEVTKTNKDHRAVLEELSVNGKKFYSNKEKSEIIANIFKNNHKIALNLCSPLDHRVAKYLDMLDIQSILIISDIEAVSKDNVKFYVNTLRNSKPSGINGINAIMLC